MSIVPDKATVTVVPENMIPVTKHEAEHAYKGCATEAIRMMDLLSQDVIHDWPIDTEKTYSHLKGVKLYTERALSYIDKLRDLKDF